MHTYLRMENEKYDIGQWLVNREGYHQFNRLFSVPSLRQAIHVVNCLNGGRQINIDNLHIFDEKP